MFRHKRYFLNYVLPVFIIICSLMIGNVSASSVDSIQLLKISVQDERAVIKTSDGKVQIIKVGDVIDDNGKVVEITAGRVVLEKKGGNETETVIIRLEDGKQRVERIKKAGEKQPQLYGVMKPQKQKEWNKTPMKEKKEKIPRINPSN